MGQFFKKALKVLLSVLMTFSLIHTSGVTRTVKAAVGDEPAHSKSLIDNHDGTYTLALSVTGDSEKNPPKTNVIVVLDVSGSMTGNAVQTQAAVATIVSKLKPGDTFSLITYSSEDHVVIAGLPILAKDDITHILEKLLGLNITGWTNGSAGIEQA
ncbi:MAG: VWA domain-containing protein, partial [Erysipelotrichales bacterium]|nr:VWA domain-containing protein [Erysipelotrichales bacterium]